MEVGEWICGRVIKSVLQVDELMNGTIGLGWMNGWRSQEEGSDEWMSREDNKRVDRWK